MWRSRTLLAAAALLALAPSVRAEVGAVTTMARADGAGKVEVELAYYAEHSCMRLADMRVGAPSSIEPPKRTLVMTVTVLRDGDDCKQELRILRHKFVLEDRADALSVDIFYLDPNGTFVRSQRPRIYRTADLDD